MAILALTASRLSSTGCMSRWVASRSLPNNCCGYGFCRCSTRCVASGCSWRVCRGYIGKALTPSGEDERAGEYWVPAVRSAERMRFNENRGRTLDLRRPTHTRLRGGTNSRAMHCGAGSSTGALREAHLGRRERKKCSRCHS